MLANVLHAKIYNVNTFDHIQYTQKKETTIIKLINRPVLKNHT